MKGWFDMLLRWYRKRIAKAVEEKMCYMGSCPNEKEIVLSIIAPKDYRRRSESHCGTDCWNTECASYHRDMKG